MWRILRIAFAEGPASSSTSASSLHGSQPHEDAGLSSSSPSSSTCLSSKAGGLTSTPPPPQTTGNRHAVVVGGGVAGVCTAFQLARRGFRVTVLEASHDVSTECSAAAAGSLQRAPLRIDSSVWRTAILSWLPAWARRSLMSEEDWRTVGESNFAFCHVSAAAALDPHFLRWFARFAKHSILDPTEKQESRQRNLSAFLSWSVDCMQRELASNPALAGDVSYTDSGLLRLTFTGKQSSSSSSNSSEASSNQHSVGTTFVDNQELLQLEPWLASSAAAPTLLGAEFHRESASAHCQRFTHSLAEMCRKELGVRFAFNTRLEGFETTTRNSASSSETRVSALLTSSGKIQLEEDDVVVMAAGVWNSPLLQRLDRGYFLPEYGLKGYTLILDVKDAEKRPKHVIVDPRTHIYMTTFGTQVRIAGIGEFGGWESKGDEKILQSLKDKAKEFAPHLTEEIETARVAIGMRPFVANGTLLLGRMYAYRNLYINTGPGSSGWTAAMGSSELIARFVNGESLSDLAFNPYAFEPTPDEVPSAPVLTNLCKLGDKIRTRSEDRTRKGKIEEDKAAKIGDMLFFLFN